jgi:hypothetical protein
MKNRDWIGRVPCFLLLAGMAVLYVGLPYASLDGDAASFGIMGQDILRYHYLPSLPYGQNYLFSLTPYLYAFWSTVLPAGVSPAVVYALAGSLLSLGGLALVFGSFRIVQERRGGGVLGPAALFALLIAGNGLYITNMAVNSGVELALFVLGVMLWAAAHLEQTIASKDEPPFSRRSAGWYALLGLGIGYGISARPMVVIYGLFLAGLLLARQGRQGGRAAVTKASASLAAGLLTGYCPMLLHQLFRAPDWPVAFHVRIALGSFPQFIHSAKLVFGTLLPAVFDVRTGMSFWLLRLAVWALAIVGGYGWAVFRRDERLSSLDHALAWGSLVGLLVVSLVPALSVDMSQSRYCLQAFLAGAWLFARWAPAPGWRKTMAWALCAALLASAAPRWVWRIDTLARRDREIREIREAMVPELVGHHAVILTAYFDAYLLDFLAERRIWVESYPWDHVRNFGLIPKAAFDHRTLWLVPRGAGHATTAALKIYLGTNDLSHADAGIRTPLLGRHCELWAFADREMASRLMVRQHPRYFNAAYPPGSSASRAKP